MLRVLSGANGKRVRTVSAKESSTQGHAVLSGCGLCRTLGGALPGRVKMYRGGCMTCLVGKGNGSRESPPRLVLKPAWAPRPKPRFHLPCSFPFHTIRRHPLQILPCLHPRPRPDRVSVLPALPHPLVTPKGTLTAAGNTPDPASSSHGPARLTAELYDAVCTWALPR